MLAHGVLYDALDVARDQLALGLRIEGRIGVLDVQHADQALASIIPRDPHLDLFEQALGLPVGIQGLGQRSAQTGQVGAAVLVVDVIRVAADLLSVTGGPLQGDVHRHHVPAPGLQRHLGVERHHLVVDRLFALAEQRHKFPNAALVLVAIFLRFHLPLIAQQDDQAGVQERQLAQAAGQKIVPKHDLGEDRRVGDEGDGRPRVVRFTRGRDRRLRHAAAVILGPDPPLPPNFHGQLGRHGVHCAHAHAV
jgi:hypothetical protein